MLKPLLILFFISTFQVAIGQYDTIPFDWRKVEYKTVKAYLFGLRGDQSDIIKNGQLNPTVVDTVGTTLTKSQIERVISVITGENDGEMDEIAECFIPHHGIVFYNTRNIAIGYVSICFFCSRKKIEPKINSPGKGIEILRTVIVELGHPVFDHPVRYIEYGEKLKKLRNK